MKCAKLAYPSRRAANRSLSVLRRRSPAGYDTASVYRCRKCGKFHIGHDTGYSLPWHKIKEKRK